MGRRIGLLGATVTLGCLLGLAGVEAVSATPPTSDVRAGAVAVEVGETKAESIVDATTSPDDPAPCVSGDTESRSVWFSFTATASGPIVVAIKDPELAMHVLAPDGATELGCTTTRVGDNVEIDVLNGETYLIEEAALVDDPRIDTAAVRIELPIDVTIAPPATGRVLSDTGIAFNFGRVRFDITIDCPIQAASGAMHLVLEQGSGASKVSARNTTEDGSYSCQPPSYSFDLLIPSGGPDPDAIFHPGPANLAFQYSAITEGGQRFESANWQGTIQLVGGAPRPEVTVPPTSTVAPASRPADGSPLAPIALGLVALMSGLASWAAVGRSRRRGQSPDRP
jgi:hypothetical protein